MKTLKEYLIKESKLNRTKAEQIADDLIEAGNAQSHSFWATLEEDDLTGEFTGLSYEEFEPALREYLINVLMQYDTPIDCEEFTNAIQSAYCGDEAGEADWGYNAHEEILGYVEEVFKKHHIA